MTHSTVTRKGQTTIPVEVREALGIKAGNRLQYEVKGESVTIRVSAGAGGLAGVLASDRGKGLSFAEIRQHAATRARQGRTKRGNGQ